MEHTSESLRQDSLVTNPLSPVGPTDAAGPQYAEVAVPVHVLSTFIYRLPVSKRQVAQIGSRIVVPLGRKFVTGYIVALLEDLPAGTSLKESAIKHKDRLDVYSDGDAGTTATDAGWPITTSFRGRVIKAALPPGISPTIDQFLSLTERAAPSSGKWSSDDTLTNKQRILQLLGGRMRLSLQPFPITSVNAGDQVGGNSNRDGLQIRQRPRGTFVKAKFQRRVRLIAPRKFNRGTQVN